MNFTTSNINFFDELAQVKIPCFLSEDLLKLKNALSNGKKLEVTIVPERKKRSLNCNSYLGFFWGKWRQSCGRARTNCI